MLFLIAYIASVVLINYAFSSAPDLDITLTYVNEQREALIEARTAIGEAILERLSSTCA